ncbi:MAG: hypothetical protein IID50_09495 [Proteobacteria bacterium]|nr:hypothetical protein [Pseudomonadota bacterium]
MSRAIDPKQICFLCGELLSNGQQLDEEHVFPRWILRKYEKVGQFGFSIGQERQRQVFYSHKCKVHRECNRAFAQKIETPVSHGNFSDHVLWIWCLKIIIGLRFFEYGFDLVRARPGADKNFTLDEYPDDANSFWELSEQLLRNGEFSNTPVFTVIEIDYLFDEPEFFYNVHHELGVMWIAFDGRSFVVFFRSLLGRKKIECYKHFWAELDRDAKRYSEDFPPQVRYNIFCARVAIDNYFSGSDWSFDFSQGHNSWVPTRLPHTSENEDFFYEFFNLKPIRCSGRIVEWRTIPSST